jgi:hypothetical protein
MNCKHCINFVNTLALVLSARCVDDTDQEQ